jgi:hypothetical protein
MPGWMTGGALLSAFGRPLGKGYLGAFSLFE